jgi:hypothetical protein
MSDSRHYLTGELVLKESWSPEHKALKMIPAESTQFQIELDQADGDSVTSYRRSVIVEPNTITDAKGLSSICLYAAGTLEISPSDEGNDFITIPASVGTVVAICARRVRSTVKAVMNG